ncbi:hypothetical protein F5Y16DRAFT_241450 [Xylariaceae sp. FL0255]|nr:hypothetical protein F5Y16DRAFT_241450 [Xylariaceae sp. FL0255]
MLAHPSTTLILAAAALLTGQAAARTDLSGCVSSETVAYGGASLIWYVPGTGEICAFLDCGGGAGAPVTTVPGCADYSGTATYSPSYLSGYGASSTSTTSSAPSSGTTTTASSSNLITSAPTSIPAASTSSAGGASASTSSSSTGGAAALPTAGIKAVALGAAAAGVLAGVAML